jgi:hypothetical protein
MLVVIIDEENSFQLFFVPLQDIKKKHNICHDKFCCHFLVFAERKTFCCKPCKGLLQLPLFTPGEKMMIVNDLPECVLLGEMIRFQVTVVNTDRSIHTKFAKELRIQARHNWLILVVRFSSYWEYGTCTVSLAFNKNDAANLASVGKCVEIVLACDGLDDISKSIKLVKGRLQLRNLQDVPTVFYYGKKIPLSLSVHGVNMQILEEDVEVTAIAHYAQEPDKPISNVVTICKRENSSKLQVQDTFLLQKGMGTMFIRIDASSRNHGNQKFVVEITSPLYESVFLQPISGMARYRESSKSKPVSKIPVNEMSVPEITTSQRLAIGISVMRQLQAMIHTGVPDPIQYMSDQKERSKRYVGGDITAFDDEKLEHPIAPKTIIVKSEERNTGKLLPQRATQVNSEVPKERKRKKQNQKREDASNIKDFFRLEWQVNCDPGHESLNSGDWAIDSKQVSFHTTFSFGFEENGTVYEDIPEFTGTADHSTGVEVAPVLDAGSSSDNDFVRDGGIRDKFSPLAGSCEDGMEKKGVDWLTSEQFIEDEFHIFFDGDSEANAVEEDEKRRLEGRKKKLKERGVTIPNYYAIV